MMAALGLVGYLERKIVDPTCASENTTAAMMPADDTSNPGSRTFSFPDRGQDCHDKRPEERLLGDTGHCKHEQEVSGHIARVQWVINDRRQG